MVNGSLASDVLVAGGTLGGTGTIGGFVTIGNGGTLAAGQSPGTLTVGSMALDAGSTTIFELGEAGVAGGANNDLVRVTGNLALNGGAIRVVRGAGFGAGQYTLFTFDTVTGALGNLTLEPLGGGFLGNLALGARTMVLNTSGASDLVWWNGTTTTPTGAVVGGDGTWSLGGGNFTNSAGTVSGPWAGNGSLAAFGGTGGRVMIAAGEAITAAGLNFVSDGYGIVGADAASRLVLAGPTGIDTADGVTASIGAMISGSGGLTKTGAGTLTLTAANTFTGLTNVLGGTLANEGRLAGGVSVAANLRNSAAIAGLVDVLAGGAATNSFTGTFGAGASIAAGGSLTNAGTITGAVTNAGILANSGTISGAVVNSGSLTSTGELAGSVTNSGTAVVSGRISGTLTNSGTATASGRITGALVNSGSVTLGGTLRLTGALEQTASGVFDVAGRGAVLGGLSGAGAVRIGSGILTVGGSNASTSFAGVISGSGGLTKLGTGTLTLTGANSFTGLTSIDDGGVVLASGASLGGTVGNAARFDNAGTVSGRVQTFTGGTTRNTGTFAAGAGNLGTLENAGAIIGEVVNSSRLINEGTITGAVLNGAALVSSGQITGPLTNSGTAEISGVVTGAVSNSGTLALTGTITGDVTNTETGTARLAGVLNGALANDGRVVLTGAVSGIGAVTQGSGGSFDLAGISTAIGSLAGAGTVLLGAGTLTTGSNNVSTTFAGVISGSGGLTKTGAGTLTLTGANSFTGLTAVNAGTLVLSATGVIGGAVSNAANLENAGTIAGDVRNIGVLGNAGTIGGSVVNAVSLTNSGIITGMLDNTATGTLVNSGTLRADVVNAGLMGNSGAIAGNVSNAGTLVLSATGVIGGAVSNAGLLDNAGTIAGSVSNSGTLANGRTITGSVVNAGMLANSGTISGAVVNTGSLTSTGTLRAGLDNSGTAEIAGVLNGAVINSGTLTLTGATSGIGAVTQGSGGRFDLAGTSTAIGSLAGAGTVQLGAATLTTGSNNALTSFAGVISGSGGLTKTGTGTLTLTGTNTFTGITTISLGALQVGDGGTSGALGSGAIVNNGVLALNRSDAVRLANPITGTGLLIHSGTGTTTLTGTNSYTGGTLVSAGRLVGDTAALQGAILNNAVVEFALPTSGIFAGVLGGSGRVEKTGAGVLTFAGNGSSLTGPFAVLGGGLRLDAANGGRLDQSVVTLASGTTLSGTGLIGGLVVQNGALVTPGNSLGVIGVAGNVAFNPGSRFLAQVSQAGADLIAAAGTARLAGALEVVNIGAPAGYRFNATFDLVTASGGVQGSFDTVSFSGFDRIFRPTLRTTANGLALVLAPGSVAGLAGSGLTANQAAVAARFDAAVAAGFDPQAFFDVYRLTPAALAGALDQLSGEIHAGMGRAAMRQSNLPRAAVLERAAGVAAADTPQGNSWGSWGKLMQSWGDVASTPGTAAQDTDTQGFVIGFDGGTANDARALRFGVYGSYLDTRVAMAARGSSGRIEQAGGGVYASLALGGFSLVAGGGAARFDITTNRTLTLPGLAGGTSTASGGDMAQVFARMGYRFDLGAASLEPFVAGDHAAIALDQTTERGGAAALAVGRQHYKVSGASAGVAGKLALGGLRLESEAAVRFELGDRVPQVLTALATAPGQSARITATHLAGTAFTGRLGAVLPLTRRITLRADYAGEFSSTDTAHTAQAGLTIAF